MASFDPLVTDALSVPLGDLIASMGRGVADAQREMDAASIAALQDIYEANEGLFLELQRIGYRPTWYHIPEAEGEIQVALTVTGQQTTRTGGAAGGGADRLTRLPRVKVYAAPLDAGYTSKYNFTLEASSRLRFRIVPIPPSAAAEGMQVAPALVGLTVAEARERLTLLNIPAETGTAADSAVVTGQVPEAGSILPRGGSVTLTVS